MMLKLKQIRLSMGVSASKLSRDSGVPLRTIQDIERRGDCMVSNLSKLATALGLTLNDLWEFDQEKAGE